MSVRRPYLDPHALARLSATVATGTVAGKQVDRPPHCPACGRVVAEYAARPYSIPCKNCGAKVTRD